MASTVPHKIHLDESEMPTQWYNVVADLPSPPPPALHPGTHQPVGPDDFAPLFPMAMIEQEVTAERYIDIPGEVLDIYQLWRPSPLFRAHRLEALLDTPARIYYKYEGVSPAGSHKTNTSVPQAYYNHRRASPSSPPRPAPVSGVPRSPSPRRSTAWSARSGRWPRSYKQKPYRKTMMEIWGATRALQPVGAHRVRPQLLAENPDHPGSLGIAICEAVRCAVADPNTRYSLG